MIWLFTRYFTMYNMKEMYFFLQNIRHLYLCIKSLSISLSGHINSILLVNNVQKKKKNRIFFAIIILFITKICFFFVFQKEIEKIKEMFMRELKDMNEKYQSSERAMIEMEQRLGKKSNLGDLQDDVDNERELLRQQKEEVAMLKEQLERQLRNASLESSTRTSEMDRRSRREERSRVRLIGSVTVLKIKLLSYVWLSYISPRYSFRKIMSSILILSHPQSPYNVIDCCFCVFYKKLAQFDFQSCPCINKKYQAQLFLHYFKNFQMPGSTVVFIPCPNFSPLLNLIKL